VFKSSAFDEAGCVFLNGLHHWLITTWLSAKQNVSNLSSLTLCAPCTEC